MPAFQGFIFDMDGVLVDSEPVYMEQERHSYARHGVVLDEAQLSRFVGTTQRHMWSAIKTEYGLADDLDCLMAEHHRQLMDVLNSAPLPPMPGVTELLDALKRAGIPCAVASSSPRTQVELILRNAGLHLFFSEIVCGDDVTHSKPDPEIFLMAAKRLGISPSSCVVIEDAAHGVAAAKAASMFCVGLLNPNSGQQDLSAADLHVHRHSEINHWFFGK
ncbi:MULTISPECIES: HAD family phosphatase [unclassified Pseudomonas]|uniref:HAD family hydrolase n=1 Tax=unclassified Pseudomonas TaxID=196821 RepID=UPI0008714CB8|nr:MULTISPECIES: HAD family phosphatase [unclassified Pseudomonas]SCW90367.1 haloacid dehalogenase superfamily, subfamily IA, variant 3 with third motif having DD or ED/haloacid dehalogenase superfamily, subfamily IA, variant 1 with third motif having Dx(3-4)D or Dx(3-4)E [Pseudomonas sp. NFACC56-3]SFK42530.1 haloacid dehalogenase superfamily, subfamily IA, variant 3 with third motif having DD or ED/haloacid dehalogenase superfamily, subfamily IA, variant 1 with third motif having Dx(3-4)D or Dx(